MQRNTKDLSNTSRSSGPCEAECLCYSMRDQTQVQYSVLFQIVMVPTQAARNHAQRWRKRGDVGNTRRYVFKLRVGGGVTGRHSMEEEVDREKGWNKREYIETVEEKQGETKDMQEEKTERKMKAQKKKENWNEEEDITEEETGVAEKTRGS